MKILKWILRILIAILLLMISFLAVVSIYTFSSESGDASGARSDALTTWIKDNVQEHVESSPTGQKIVNKVKELVVEYSPYGSDWNQNIRKLAHFSEYFLLATLLYMVLSVLKVPWWAKFLLILLACGGVACWDEFHQSQVPGRVMNFTDVLIDTSGAVSATCLYGIFGSLWRWLKV